LLDDLNIHDDFLDEDAFWAVKSYAQTSTYYTPEELNKMLGINEGWTGLRTINVKTIFSGLTEKIEKTTGKVVDRIHFYKCEGNNIPNFEEPLSEISQRTHRDSYPWAGVIYLWGEAGTYYNGEKIDFKENRFIWYNGQEPHAPMASIEDRCVMVVFMLDKSREV
jgi:hypothetical protein